MVAFPLESDSAGNLLPCPSITATSAPAIGFPDPSTTLTANPDWGTGAGATVSSRIPCRWPTRSPPSARRVGAGRAVGVVRLGPVGTGPVPRSPSGRK